MILSTYVEALALFTSHVSAARIGSCHDQLHGFDVIHTEIARRSEAPMGAMLLARFDDDGLPIIIERRHQNGKACPKCLERCPRRDQIVSEEDCNRCKRCPTGLGADVTYKNCVPDDSPDRAKDDPAANRDGNQGGEGQKKKGPPDSRPEKLEALSKTFNMMKIRWMESKDARERKAARDKAAADAKHNKVAKEWKDQQQADKEKRSRARRAGRCLAIVPFVMGTAAISEYGDGAFDEDFLENEVDELAAIIPKDVKIDLLDDDDSDSKWEAESYIKLWTAIANREPETYTGSNCGIKGGTCAFIPKRNLPRGQHVEVQASEKSSTALSLVDTEHQHEKRWFFAIVPALIRTVGVIGRILGQGARLLRIAKGAGGKLSRGGMKEAAKKIAKDRNWRQCVEGKGPLQDS